VRKKSLNRIHADISLLSPAKEPEMYGRPLGLLVIACWGAGLALGSAIAGAQNLLTDLGPGTATGINNSGQVVLLNGIWSNGVVAAFPTGFTGNAINSNGQVAGVLTSNGNIGSAAFYSNGTVTVIGADSDPTVNASAALGINDNGVVAGQGYNSAGDYAFVYNNGALTAVPPFAGSAPGNGKATGINDNGLVIGWMSNSVPDSAPTDVFIYNSNTAILTDLGPGAAFAINASGQGTGGSNATGHAALYSEGTVIDLGVLPGGSTSSGYAINATGQIVGGSTILESAAAHAFFYNGVMIDLNALVSPTDPLYPYVTLDSAQGINDNRLIVANGVDIRTQLQHAYLLQGPWLDVAPGPLSFPSQVVGTVSSAQSVTLTNSGSTVMTPGTISTSGDFSQTNNCGALAAGAGCAVTVTFAPTAAGNLTGALTVVSAGVPIAIPLSGVASIQVSITSSDATTTANVPVKLTWTVSPGASCIATGGSANDGWAGTVAPSGTQSVAESHAGTYPYGLACTAGTQSQSNQTSVVVTWPAVTVSLTAVPTPVTAGQSITVNWTSTNATSCTATGGGIDDTWAGAKATSGSLSLAQAYAPNSASSTLNYTLNCTSAVSGLSAVESVKVVENANVAAPAMSGGGGALDLISIIALLSILGCNQLRKLAAQRHRTRMQFRLSKSSRS
jgi:probable HAF family extracellular repeat protein